VRPLEVPRPVRGTVGGSGAERAGWWGAGLPLAGPGPRLLVRATVRGRTGAVSRVRRVLVGVAVVATSAAVVVVLGVLARFAEPAPAPVRAPAPVVVTAGPDETAWDVAARVASGRPGVEVAAVAERIVADNALRSVRLEPGQVLRVAGS
jgi:hypothetical protein